MAAGISKIGLVLAAAALLAGCTSARFGGGPPVVPRGAAINEPVIRALEPGMAAPSGTVIAEPLAPPPGAEDFNPNLPTISGQGVAEGGQRLAAVTQPTAPPRVTRTTFVGTWSAREPGGSSCRITLSSAAALDLYRATTSGCANEDISGVNSWDLRGNEIYLYRRGGAVAARLQASPGSMSGVLARSGAPLTMSR